MAMHFDITPTEFEIYVKRFLEAEGIALKNFRAEHLETLRAHDGEYVIDVTARFEAFGASFLVLVECKRYGTDPVEREQIQALKQKRDSIGAHKAMAFTTSSFRRGAVNFARSHGIALVKVTSNGLQYSTKSWLPNLNMEIIEPGGNSLAEFANKDLSEATSDEEKSVRSDAEDFILAVNRERLDYLRVLQSRGYDVKKAEIDALEAEISASDAV